MSSGCCALRVSLTLAVLSCPSWCTNLGGVADLITLPGSMPSLYPIADSLALLPGKDDIRERVLPLHSVLLERLMPRMMEPCANPRQSGLVLLDELARRSDLPELQIAVTENRNSGNPVLLRFRWRSQLEKRYGQNAEAMLSQPATKIFSKTSEPRAAKRISEALGETKIERLTESLTPGLLRSKKHFGREIVTKPLVIPSESEHLEPLRGFSKQKARVVPVCFQPLPRAIWQPEMVGAEDGSANTSTCDSTCPGTTEDRASVGARTPQEAVTVCEVQVSVWSRKHCIEARGGRSALDRSGRSRSVTRRLRRTV